MAIRLYVDQPLDQYLVCKRLYFQLSLLDISTIINTISFIIITSFPDVPQQLLQKEITKS